VPDYVLGFQTLEELTEIQAILQRFSGQLAEFLTHVSGRAGIRVPTVLPILREVLLPEVPVELVKLIRASIPTVRYIVESRSAPFVATFHPVETLPPGAVPELEWGLERIGIARTGLTGRGVRVAVLDTGLDVRHPDFHDRPNTVFMDERSSVDLAGHGTFVSGLIAGPMRPAQAPRYGIAPDVTLYVANVTDDGGHASNEMNLSAGVEWALGNNCQVINMSWQIPFDASRPVSFLESKGEEALARGCLVIAAGGNFSDRKHAAFRPVSEPGHARSVLAVGSIGMTDGVSNFSPRADDIPGGEVDFVAPGEQIRSSTRVPVLPDTEIYATSSFTSFSAPMVTAVAALQLESGVQPDQLRHELERLASPIAGDARDTGHGVPLAP
jgi:subtilisin